MRTVWLRLGRTDAINWIVISAIATLQFVGSFVITNTNTGGQELLFLACVLVSVLVVVGMLLATRYWIIPYVAIRVRPFVIVIMLQLSAFARTYVFDSLLVGFNFSESDLFLSRLYASQFNIFVAGIVVSSLVSMARDFSESNDKLFLTIEELRAAQEDLENRVTHRRNALVTSIRSQLHTSISSLTGTNVSADALSLKSLIDEVVRPISHRLGREFEPSLDSPPPLTTTTIRWSTVYRYALESNPVHPFWLTMWTAFVSLLVISSAAGPNFVLPYFSALFGFAFWFTLSWLVWGLCSRLLGLYMRAAVFSVLILATPVIVNYPLELLFNLDFFNTRVVVSGAMYFIVMAWTLALVIALSHLLRTTNNELTKATTQLRRQLISDNVNARHFEQAVSLVLNGPIQDAIAASLKRIQSLPPDALPGTSEGDIIRQHIEDALHLLDESPIRHYSVEQGVKDLAQLWDGVVEIQVNCDITTWKALDDAQTTSSIAIEVIREAISNAIRHGDASRINVEISSVDSQKNIVIRVTNNGSFLSEEQPEGIGTKLLRSMTLEWSRENQESGVVLTAVVPLNHS